MITANTRTTLTNPDTRAMLRDVLEASASKEAVALMLKMAGCPAAQVYYMAGPIILMEPEQRGGPSSQPGLPLWLTRALHLDRLERILTEVEAGQVGPEATPADVLAYLQPALAFSWWPFSDEWTRIYLWTRYNVLSRHEPLAQGQVAWELVDAHRQPVQPALILTGGERQAFRELAGHLRRLVVEAAARRDTAGHTLRPYREQLRPLFADFEASFEALFRERRPDGQTGGFLCPS